MQVGKVGSANQLKISDDTPLKTKQHARVRPPHQSSASLLFIFLYLAVLVPSIHRTTLLSRQRIPSSLLANKLSKKLSSLGLDSPPSPQHTSSSSVKSQNPPPQSSSRTLLRVESYTRLISNTLLFILPSSACILYFVNILSILLLWTGSL